jgi:hypothetical protein
MKKHIGVLLAVAVFLIQAVLLPHVGASWDEPSSFFMGRANLKFWLMGNRAYLNDFKSKTLFTDSPIPYIYGEDLYPPFPFLVASAFSYVFAEKLHVMQVVDAHHLGEVAIGSLGVWGMYGLATVAGLSVPTAVATTLTYVLYPTIFGLMRSDAKDVPLVSMLIVSAYFFLSWLTRWQKKQFKHIWRDGILFGITFGLAEASKPTAAIFVPIVVTWLVLSTLRSKAFRKSIAPKVRFSITIGLFLAIAVIVFFFAWPWLWDDPITKLTEVITFFKDAGYNMLTPYFGYIYNAAVSLPKSYPFLILFIQTPVEISLLAILAFVSATRRFITRAETVPFLFVVWFVIGMGRFLIPGMIIYSWVRHFIDVMPAFFILAGFGLEWGADAIVPWVKGRVPAVSRYVNVKSVIYLAMAVIVFHEAYISVSFFPYEVSYFNMLIGGTKNVADKWLFDVGQAGAVKEAMEFIARDSKGNPTLVYPCQMGHLALLYLAPNVKLTRAPEMGNYTIIPNSPSWFEGALTFAKTHHEKAYIVRRAGADILYVLRYTSPFGWRCGWETVTNYEY